MHLRRFTRRGCIIELTIAGGFCFFAAIFPNFRKLGLSNLLKNRLRPFIIKLAVKSITITQRREYYDRILRTGQQYVPDHKRS